MSVTPFYVGSFQVGGASVGATATGSILASGTVAVAGASLSTKIGIANAFTLANAGGTSSYSYYDSSSITTTSGTTSILASVAINSILANSAGTTVTTVAGLLVTPSITNSTVSSVITNPSAIYVKPTFTGTVTLSNVYGHLIDTITSGGGTITTAYGSYIKVPTAGTTNVAIYADNMAIGTNATLPPSNGLLVLGSIKNSALSTSSLVATDGSSNLTSSTSGLSPTFTGLTLSGLTSSLLWANASHVLAAVALSANFAGSFAGTLDTVQGIQTTSNPQFNSLGIGVASSGTAGTIYANVGLGVGVTPPTTAGYAQINARLGLASAPSSTIGFINAISFTGAAAAYYGQSITSSFTYSSGSITQSGVIFIDGTAANITTTGGTISTLAGGIINNVKMVNTSGTFAAAYGYYSLPIITGTTTITRYAGVYLDTPTITGTVTNSYGIYNNAPVAGATNYGYYQTGTFTKVGDVGVQISHTFTPATAATNLYNFYSNPIFNTSTGSVTITNSYVNSLAPTFNITSSTTTPGTFTTIYCSSISPTITIPNGQTTVITIGTVYGQYVGSGAIALGGSTSHRITNYYGIYNATLPTITGTTPGKFGTVYGGYFAAPLTTTSDAATGSVALWADSFNVGGSVTTTGVSGTAYFNSYITLNGAPSIKVPTNFIIENTSATRFAYVNSTLVAIGSGAAALVTANMVAIGASAGANTTDSNNTFIGINAGTVMGATSPQNTVVGYGAGSGAAVATVNGNSLFGYNACPSLTGTASYNTVIGCNAANSLQTGSLSCIIGFRALYLAQNTGYHTIIGTDCLHDFNNSAVNARATVAIGYTTGYYFAGEFGTLVGTGAATNMNGSNKAVVMGYNAGFGYLSSTKTATDVTLIGYNTAYYIDTADYATVVGCNAGYALKSGKYNTIIGANAGSSLISGDGCVFIGYSAGASETTANKLYIANTNTVTPLIYGDFSTAKLTVYNYLGIAMSPTYALDVTGQSRFSSNMALVTTPSTTVGFLNAFSFTGASAAYYAEQLTSSFTYSSSSVAQSGVLFIDGTSANITTNAGSISGFGAGIINNVKMVNTSGTFANMYGYYSLPSITATTGITQFASIYLDTPSITTGTNVPNAYGIYNNVPTGAVINTGFYQTGTFTKASDIGFQLNNSFTPTATATTLYQQYVNTTFSAASALIISAYAAAINATFTCGAANNFTNAYASAITPTFTVSSTGMMTTAMCQYISPTVNVTTVTTGTMMSAVYGINITAAAPTITTASTIVTNYYGIYCGTMAAKTGSGNFANAYSAYFAAPVTTATTTSSMALYATNASFGIGNTAISPPTNGILVQGNILNQALSPLSLVGTDASKNLTSTTSGITPTFAGLNLTAALTVANGGTGLTSCALGNVPYGNGTNSMTLLPGNTSTSRLFFTQTGDGVNSAAPQWSAIAASDFGTTLSPQFTSIGLGTAAINDAFLVTGARTATSAATTWHIRTTGTTTASSTTTLLTAIGCDVTNKSSGATLTNAAQINLTPNVDATSNIITNSSAMLISAGTNVAGTVTNSYGIYNNISTFATNNFGYYQAGTFIKSTDDGMILNDTFSPTTTASLLTELSLTSTYNPTSGPYTVTSFMTQSITPTILKTSASVITTTAFYNLNINPSSIAMSGAAHTINDMYNIYSAIPAPTLANSSTITRAYSGYFVNPSAGTSSVALYADSALIGGSTVTTAMTAGTFKIGTLGAGVICAPSSLGVSATSGFLYIPSLPGGTSGNVGPTGTPTTQAGTIPMAYDTDNNQLFLYNGGWRGVGECLIRKYTVSGTTTGTVSFTSIPQVFNRLKIVIIGQIISGAVQYVLMRFNGISTATYDYEQSYGNNATAGAINGTTQTSFRLPWISGDTLTASKPGQIIVEIPEYTSSNWYKSYTAYGGCAPAVAASSYSGIFTGSNRATTAITQIDIIADGSLNFKANTVIYLYGIM